jgi:hypothetical protein
MIAFMGIGMPMAFALVLTGASMAWVLDFWDTQLLAQNLGVEEQEIREVELGMSAPDISLDAPIKKDDGDLRYIDTLNMMEQSIDITSVPDGQYRIREIADPFDWFEETDETNNETWVDIDIKREAGIPVVTVIGRAP